MLSSIFLIIFSFAWGIFAWKKPASAVLWFPILLPAYVLRTKIGPLPTTLLELALLATIVGVTATCKAAVWRAGFDRCKPWLLPVGLWIIATVISIFVAPDHVAALGLWRAYILEPLIYFVLLLGIIKTEEDKWALIRSLIIVTVAVAVWAIFQFATGFGIPHPWDVGLSERRATGPFPYPNALSLFCAPIAALCFGLVMMCHPRENGDPGNIQILPIKIIQMDSRFRGNDNKPPNDSLPEGKHKALPLRQIGLGGGTPPLHNFCSLFTVHRSLWLGFISGLTATLLAKSMGGTLAILAAVLVTLIWQKRTRLVTLIVVAVSVLTILIVPTLRTPLMRNLSFQDWSGKVRLIIWKESWHMLKDRPILGAGLGAYPEVIKPYHQATYIEIFQYPHNILLNLWSETGVLGILAFVWIVTTWIRLAIKKNLSPNHPKTPPNLPLPRGGMAELNQGEHRSPLPSIPYQLLTAHCSLLLPLLAILIQGLVDVPYFKNDLAIMFWIFAALVSSI